MVVDSGRVIRSKSFVASELGPLESRGLKFSRTRGVAPMS